MSETLGDKLAEARAEVARLETLAKVASCAELNHPKRQIGGCNAGCDLGDLCCCSVPVHDCTCGAACDYGVNDEADEVRQQCAIGRDYPRDAESREA